MKYKYIRINLYISFKIIYKINYYLISNYYFFNIFFLKV